MWIFRPYYLTFLATIPKHFCGDPLLQKKSAIICPFASIRKPAIILSVFPCLIVSYKAIIHFVVSTSKICLNFVYIFSVTLLCELRTTIFYTWFRTTHLIASPPIFSPFQFFYNSQNDSLSTYVLY